MTTYELLTKLPKLKNEGLFISGDIVFGLFMYFEKNGQIAQQYRVINGLRGGDTIIYERGKEIARYPYKEGKPMWGI